MKIETGLGGSFFAAGFFSAGFFAAGFLGSGLFLLSFLGLGLFLFRLLSLRFLLLSLFLFRLFLFRLFLFRLLLRGRFLLRLFDFFFRRFLVVVGNGRECGQGEKRDKQDQESQRCDSGKWLHGRHQTHGDWGVVRVR